MNFGLDATTAASIWVLIGLLIFLGIIVYFGVPKMIGKVLDDRIRRSENEPSEAERLGAEAKALLEEYRRKREEADKEAEGIVAAAREEAFRLTAEAKESLETLIARRERAVAEKIGQAEAQAVAEVRARSADVAVEAARRLLIQQMPTKGEALVEQAIKDVGERLN